VTTTVQDGHLRAIIAKEMNIPVTGNGPKHLINEPLKSVSSDKM
jgi:hypothetical protein